MGIFNWGKNKRAAKKDNKTNHYSSRGNTSNNVTPADDSLHTTLWLSSLSDDSTPSHDSTTNYDSGPSYDSGGYDGASDSCGGADW